MRITFVPKTGDPVGEILTEVKALEADVKKEMDLIGEETALQMKRIINESKVRPQSDEPTDLENAIQFEKFENGWGVGAIEELRQKAPGWAAINFGSTHLVGKHLPTGTFNPGEPAPNDSFFRAGRWKKGESYNGESYSPLITRPIPPMNYIEKTLNWLSNKINSLRK